MPYLLRLAILASLLTHATLASAQEDNPWADVEEEAPEPKRPKDMKEPEPKPKEKPRKRRLKPNVRVKLKSGEVLVGAVASRDEDSVAFQLASGRTRVLYRAEILSVTPLPRDKREAPKETSATPTRYLYSPSAFMLEQGEAYISQKELFFTSFGLGLTDNVSVLFGSALPFWFIGGGQNFILGAKVGGEVSENVHLAAGFEGILITGALNQGGLPLVPFATGTIGDPTAHLSISIGGLFLFDFDRTEFDDDNAPLISIDAYYQLNPNFGLLTENIILSIPFNNTASAHALAMRFLFDKLNLDVGFVVFQSNGTFGPFPIPWLDLSYGFQAF